MMLQLTFTSLHCFLIRNGFGFYVVSFIAALAYGAYRRQLSVNIIEFAGHSVLLLVLGRMVFLVSETSSAMQQQMQGDDSTADGAIHDETMAPRGSWDLITIGFLFCFASNIASFLFGISLGKMMEKDDGTKAGSEAEPKKRWLDRRFVIKPKTPSTNKLASSSGAGLSSVSVESSGKPAVGGAGGAGGDQDSSSSLSSLTIPPPASSPASRNGNAIKLYTQRARNGSEDGTAVSPMEWTMEKAKQTVLSILNLAEVPRYRDLQLAEIRQESHPNGLCAKLFTTTERTFGIYLSGSCHTYLSPEAVLRWLKQYSYTTGFETIAPEQEISTQSKSKKIEATVRRLVSKPEGLMSSKRDFMVVTCVSKLEEAGAYVIATRSMEQDIANAQTTQGHKKKGGYLRGVVYGCGWILHPWVTGEGEDYGCEVSYAAHIDMMGAPTSTVNKDKEKVLADRVLDILSYFAKTEDEKELKLEKVEPGGILASDGSPRRKSSHQSPLYEASPSPTEIETASDGISAENRLTLLKVAKDALDNLRKLHATYRPATPAASAAAASAKESWDVFYEQNGVSVRELRNNASSLPVGILSASCTTEAPPHVVRQLLMNHPKEVDALLEGRTILAKLDQQSFVQWLAYGTIWPIGARDFLLATTEDAYDERTGDGFVIASTSIDHLCELEGEVVKGEADDLGEPSYSRSSLKLAGYVGVPNGNGGTDVSLFVDVDVYSYIPAWLLQVLAQYGLSEMMSRIQRSTTGHPQMSFRNDITRMLSRIETTEAKMRTYVLDHNLPVPKDAAYGLDGSSRGSVTSAGGGLAKVSSPETTPGRRSLHERSSIQSAHMPVPSVLEAQHRRASVRRASMSSAADAGLAGNLANGPYAEYMDKTQALSEEALHLMKVYLGLEELKADEPALALDWKEKKKERSTTVYGTTVAGSTWNAVRAVGQVRANKADILKLLIDDKRIGEFDDMFDSVTVRCSLVGASCSHRKRNKNKTLALFLPLTLTHPPLPFPLSLFPFPAVSVQGGRKGVDAPHGFQSHLAYRPSRVYGVLHIRGAARRLHHSLHALA